MNNGAVRCGNNICRPISGIFTKNPLPNGYIHIATIPAGASNISITELKSSNNFLGKFFLRVHTISYLRNLDGFMYTHIQDKKCMI